MSAWEWIIPILELYGRSPDGSSPKEALERAFEVTLQESEDRAQLTLSAREYPEIVVSAEFRRGGTRLEYEVAIPEGKPAEGARVLAALKRRPVWLVSSKRLVPRVFDGGGSEDLRGSYRGAWRVGDKVFAVFSSLPRVVVILDASSLQTRDVFTIDLPWMRTFALSSTAVDGLRALLSDALGRKIKDFATFARAQPVNVERVEGGYEVSVPMNGHVISRTVDEEGRPLGIDLSTTASPPPRPR